MKITKTDIIVLIAILILSAIMFLPSKPEKPFSKIELTKNSYIYNTTKTSYLDTIIDVGLNQLHIKNVRVVIKPMNNDVRNQFDEGNQGIDLEAYIVGDTSLFIIRIDPNNTREKNIEILAHELIHLQQYHSKNLKIVGDTEIVFKNDTFTTPLPSYYNRPWEEEAIYKSVELSAQIDSILYNK